MLELLALARIWWKAALGIALGAALAFPIGHFIGHRSGVKDGIASEQKAEAKRLDAARKAVKAREAKADKVTAKVSSDLTKTQTQIVYRTRTLIERIPANVSPDADRRCELPVGFVRLHDTAALGASSEIPIAARGPEIPGPQPEAAEVLDAPSGVPLSGALAVVVENYGVAAQLRAEVLSWRAWYAAQAAAWGS